MDRSEKKIAFAECFDASPTDDALQNQIGNLSQLILLCLESVFSQIGVYYTFVFFPDQAFRPEGTGWLKPKVLNSAQKFKNGTLIGPSVFFFSHSLGMDHICPKFPLFVLHCLKSVL